MEATRQLAARMNYYGREIGFYRDCAHDCGVKVPQCYSAESVQEDNRFAMIIEDLAPASPVDQVEGCSFEESAKVMRAFADLHAHWWNSPKLTSLAWPSPITHVQPASESLALLEASIIDAEKTGRFDAYPNMKRLLPLLRPYARWSRLHPFRTRWFTETFAQITSFFLSTPRTRSLLIGNLRNGPTHDGYRQVVDPKHHHRNPALPRAGVTYHLP